MIFVFGSNKDGRHAGGAAAYAAKAKGAIWGCGEGLKGESYAIPTMESLDKTDEAVCRFLNFAEANPELEFQVTRVGCGIAGFKDFEIAPLFADAPANCLFDEAWKQFIPTARFWGTF